MRAVFPAQEPDLDETRKVTVISIDGGCTAGKAMSISPDNGENDDR
jgi:hypothetical protein